MWAESSVAGTSSVRARHLDGERVNGGKGFDFPVEKAYS
jgi:hypothetical protein